MNAEDIERLKNISEYNGVTYGRLQSCVDSEFEHSKTVVMQLEGYLTLSKAFRCFFLESVELLNTTLSEMMTPLSPVYVPSLARLVQHFQSLFAAEKLAINGYPFQAYTLLRNIYDDLLLTSATLQKLTDFYSILGFDPNKQFDPIEMKKLKKQTERVINNKMVGSQSGLTQPTIDQLAKWDEMFDYEVHGARLSMTLTHQDFLAGKKSLRILPMFEERAFAPFMNRFNEIGWMMCRLLPSIQVQGAPFPEEWKNKWRIIDNAFEIMVESLTKELKKKIGSAMVEFVKKKFPFNEQSVFPL